MRRLTWTVVLCLAWAAPLVAQEANAPATDSTAASPPDAASAEPSPFRRLFVTLVRDIKQLPANGNAVILINGGVLALAAYPFDEIATLGASSSHVLKAAFSGWGKALGREWVQGGGALAAYVAGRVWDKPQMTVVSGDLIEAQLLSVTLTQGLKFATSRTRPDGEARSFPSGHASAAFATASVLHRHFGKKVAIPAYAVAVYTSASRLQANSHFASDVFVGAALGIAIGRTATFDVGNARLHVRPVPVARGMAVAVAAATK
jgi:membrane-associated phospholipid phosphatase